MKLSPENLQFLYGPARARSFDAATQYASLVATLAPPMAMVCLFRTTSATTGYGLVSVDDNATNSFTPGYYMQLSDTNGRLSASSCDGSSGAHATTVNAFTANTWNFAGASFDSNSRRRSMLNQGPEALDTATINPTGLISIKIGMIGGSSQFYSGLIAWVFIWNVSLKAAEHRKIAGGYPPWLVMPDNIVFAPLMSTLFDPIYGLPWVNHGAAPLVGAAARIRSTRIHRPYMSISSGASTVTGLGSITSDIATVAGVGGEIVSGVGAISSGVATVAGAGGEVVGGVGAVAAGVGSVAGAGGEVVSGVGAVAAGVGSVAGAGGEVVGGVGGIASGAATVAGAGAEIVGGSGGIGAGGGSVGGAGTEVVGGSGGIVGGAPVVAGAGNEVVTGLGVVASGVARVAGATAQSSGKLFSSFVFSSGVFRRAA